MPSKNALAENDILDRGWSHGLDSATHDFFLLYGRLNDTLAVLERHVTASSDPLADPVAVERLETIRAAYEKLEGHKRYIDCQQFCPPYEKDVPLFDKELVQLHEESHPALKRLYANADREKEKDISQAVAAQQELYQSDYGNFRVVLDSHEELQRELKQAKTLLAEIKENEARYGTALLQEIKNYSVLRSAIMELVKTEYDYIKQCHEGINVAVFEQIVAKYFSHYAGKSPAEEDREKILKHYVKLGGHIDVIDHYKEIRHGLPLAFAEIVQFSRDLFFGLDILNRLFSDKMITNVTGPITNILKTYDDLGTFIEEIKALDNEKKFLDPKEKVVLATVGQFLIAPVQRQPRYNLLAQDIEKHFEKVSAGYIQGDGEKQGYYENTMVNMKHKGEQAPTLLNKNQEIIERDKATVASYNEQLKSWNPDESLLMSTLNVPMPMDDHPPVNDLDGILTNNSSDKIGVRQNSSPGLNSVPSANGKDSRDALASPRGGLNEMNEGPRGSLLANRSEKPHESPILDNTTDGHNGMAASDPGSQEQPSPASSYYEQRTAKAAEQVQEQKAKAISRAHIFYYAQINNILQIKASRKQAYDQRGRFFRYWKGHSHHQEQEALRYLLDIVILSHKTFEEAYPMPDNFYDTLEAYEAELGQEKRKAKAAYETLEKQWLFNPFKRYERSQRKKALDAISQKLSSFQSARAELRKTSSPLREAEAQTQFLIDLYKGKRDRIEGTDYTSLRASNIYEDCVASSKKLWFFQRFFQAEENCKVEILLHKTRSRSKAFRKAVDSLLAGETESKAVSPQLWSDMQLGH